MNKYFLAENTRGGSSDDVDDNTTRVLKLNLACRESAVFYDKAWLCLLLADGDEARPLAQSQEHIPAVRAYSLYLSVFFHPLVLFICSPFHFHSRYVTGIETCVKFRFFPLLPLLRFFTVLFLDYPGLWLIQTTRRRTFDRGNDDKNYYNGSFIINFCSY